jgi:hypothetical protein
MGAYDPKLPPEQQGPEVQIEKSVANMKNIIVSARLCKNSVHSARGEANCLN